MPLLRLGIGTFRSRTRPSTMMSVEPSRNQRKVGSGSAFALQVTVSGIVSTVTFIIFFDIVIFSGGTVERIKIRIKVAIFLSKYREALWTSIRTSNRVSNNHFCCWERKCRQASSTYLSIVPAKFYQNWNYTFHRKPTKNRERVIKYTIYKINTLKLS